MPVSSAAATRLSARTDASIRAAGGVVWRFRDGEVQIAIVHRPRYDDWSLPKGKLDEGETELMAAVREIAEEIGSRVAVSRWITRVAYQVDGVDKTVAYWVMQHLDGQFVPNDEVDALDWVPAPQARGRVSYPADRDVLDDFLLLPVPDSVVVLVRHAKAGKRSEWHGQDVDRPLQSTGRAQANRLARFLTAFAPDRVVSAPPVRCAQTVTPFAESLGVDVAIDPAFGDEDYADDPAASEAALLALGRPRRASVVCSQGEAIPGLIERVAPGVASSDTRKGAAWVLSVADGAVVSADYYASAARSPDA